MLLEMLLAIDVGNTNTSIGLFQKDSLVAECRLTTHRSWTRDEFAILLREALALQGMKFESLSAAVLANVVPPAQEPVVSALKHYAGVETLVVGPGVRTGMPIRYSLPQDVGADRIVSAVAAHHRYGKNDESDPRGVIVVDFGTATTFDVVSPQPEYQGGVIAPGIGISADALFTRAAKLPRVEITRPDNVIGNTTVDALKSGLVYGYVALVEGLIERIRNELDWPAVVVATGGLAPLIAGESKSLEAVDQDLMLEGLRLIYSRSASGR